jgi:pantetheine-phosphate adenylyltransferase
MTEKIALYPGTFDPVTNGHLDIMQRAVKVFDQLIVAVALNPKKNPMFSIEDRVHFIQSAIDGHKNISVLPFGNLLTEFACTHKANVIIKGLRAITDFEFELQMGLMNRCLDESMETLFMIPSQEYSFLSSNLVKEIAGLGGNINKQVPESVVRGFENYKK